MQYIHTLRGNSKQECNCTDNGHGTGTVPTYHWTGHCITSIIFLQRSRDENCPNIYHWTGHCITSIIFLQRSRDENCPNIYHWTGLTLHGFLYIPTVVTGRICPIMLYWTGLTLHGFLYIPTVVTGRNCPIMLLDGTHTAWLPLYSYSGHGTELSHYATRRDSHCISSSIFLQWSRDGTVP